MSEEETWSPEWAPHVVGRWNKRTLDPETGEPEPQMVHMACAQCGATYRVRCTSGAVRSWVNRFANVHFHGNPLDPGRVKRMAEARQEARREREERKKKV